MPAKRIIPCLDVDGGRTVKGVNFQDLHDMGDPVVLAEAYQEQGADELVLLDISATVEGREALLDTVEAVARWLSIPFTVGGGIDSLERVKRLLARGADKVSVNTAAMERPGLVEEIAASCGSQCCVLAVDARKGAVPCGYEVLIRGGRVPTGIDALAWAREATALGAGEILLTSWDRDGTRSGFDLDLTAAFARALPVPVIASGGAGGPQSFVEVFQQAGADAALAAGIFHDGRCTVGDVKEFLHAAGIEVRL